MSRKTVVVLPLLLITPVALYVAGCTQNDPGAATSPRTSTGDSAAGDSHSDHSGSAHSDGKDHAHVPGQHGGIIVSLGRDSYHVEAVFEQKGILRLYMLGQDETRVQGVESQELTAYAKAEGDSESISFTVSPEPQQGDAEGKASQFVGQIPATLQGRRITVTIPSINIQGERFRLGFTSASGSPGAEVPDKVSGAAETKLYLTPGGLYSQADIEANGNQAASQKFKGFLAAHNLEPRPGDKICPITLTKANPEVSWIIGGKTYEFCCPPCIDEFVALAKEKPEEVNSPEMYVKE